MDLRGIMVGLTHKSRLRKSVNLICMSIALVDGCFKVQKSKSNS